jgi:Ca-activated chloride channel family protein
LTEFLQPRWLLLALLVPLVAFLRLRRRRPAVVLGTLAIPGAMDAIPRTWRTRLAGLPALLFAAALLLATAALARPVRRVALPVRTEGADILLCLDLSSSMTARDLDPSRSRLAVARDAAAAFLRGRPSDRVGLLGFARYPDVRCPPTLDHRALGEILAEVAPVEGDGPEDATAIGAALARAAEALRRGKARTRVVILLTDGEENVATTATPGAIPPEHGARLCRELGIRVHAVAAGPGEGRALAELAAATGGRSFRARDAAGLRAAWDAIDALERSPFERPRFALEERFAPLLAAALACVAAAAGLRATLLGGLP